MRARHQTGEGGFTLVEVMVAMLLLAIALTGLAQLAGSQMVDSLRIRTRQVATSYVNQELESLRSMTYTRLAMDPNDSTIPTKSGYTPMYGSPGCAGTTCLTYSRSVSLANSQVTGTDCSTSTAGSCFTFTETRWVGQITGAAYKTVFVSVASTSGPSFTFSSQTDVSGATTNNPTAVTAIEVDLQQVDPSTGLPVTDPTTGIAEVPPDGFIVTVLQGATTVAQGPEADGAYNVTSGLSPNTTYTCTVTNPGGASYSTWAAYSAGDSSFSCNTGAAGTTASYTSNWKQLGCTYNASGADGYLTVTVYDATVSPPTPLSGVKVTLTKQQAQAKNPPPITTDSNGQASWNGDGSPANNTINNGLFSITLGSVGGYQANNNLSTTCIWSGQTSQIYLYERPTVPPSPPSSNVNLTIPVNNTYPGGTATLAIVAIDTTNTYKFEVQQDLDGCGAGCGTPTTVTLPVFKNYSYTVTVNCVGVGGITTSPPDGEALYTWNTGKVTANPTSPPTPTPGTAAVKCPTS